MDTRQHEMVCDFLVEKVARGRETFESGNKWGAAYLACIAGMWTNACKRPNRNPYQNAQEGWLNDWFECGYDAYTQAIGQTIAIRKQQMEAEKEWAEEKKKENPKKKTSKWNVKLW